MIDSLISVPEMAPESGPKTIVLQPTAALNQATLPEFEQALAAALAQATETVIVDLLWVEPIEPGAIALLTAAIQQAADLNKSLSVQSMSARTRKAFNAACDRGHELRYGSWNQLLKQELATFFDSVAHPDPYQPRCKS